MNVFRANGIGGLNFSDINAHKRYVSERKSQSVTDFRGKSLPEPATLAGYAALIRNYDLKLPLPPRLTAIESRHHPTSTDAWQLLTPRHAPEDTLTGHLEFALKWEGVEFAVLSALFQRSRRRDRSGGSSTADRELCAQALVPARVAHRSSTRHQRSWQGAGRSGRRFT